VLQRWRERLALAGVCGPTGRVPLHVCVKLAASFLSLCVAERERTVFCSLRITVYTQYLFYSVFRCSDSGCHKVLASTAASRHLSWLF
jgi:hypothetical protein